MKDKLDRFKFKVFDESKNKLYSSLKELSEEEKGAYFLLTQDGSIVKSYYGNSGEIRIINLPHLKPIFSTGLKDKNDKLIYEGDIVKWHQEEYVWQSSHVGYIDFEGYEIFERKGVVFFNNFSTEDEAPLAYLVSYKKEGEEKNFPLGLCGFKEIDDILEVLNRATPKEDHYKDLSETNLNESALGIEIIGNIYENDEFKNK